MSGRDNGVTRTAEDARKAGMRLGKFKVSGESAGPDDLMITVVNLDGMITDQAEVRPQVLGSKIVVQVTL